MTVQVLGQKIRYLRRREGLSQEMCIRDRRYSKPVLPLPGYGKASNTAELFIVENGGTLQVAGTTLDGHSEAVTQGAEALAAPAVEAQAPLVTVRSGGSFHTDDGAVLRNNRNTSADGQGGAVYIAEGGTYKLYGGSTIANTHAEACLLYTSLSKQSGADGRRLSGRHRRRGRQRRFARFACPYV